jgi:hypothetical protein
VLPVNPPPPPFVFMARYVGQITFIYGTFLGSKMLKTAMLYITLKDPQFHFKVFPACT